MNTLMLPLRADDEDADLAVAAELCREVSAHLSVLVVSLAPPPPVGEYAAVIAEEWMEERRADLERLKARGKAIADWLSQQGLAADMSEAYPEAAFADQVVGRRARYGDLTILGPALLASESLKSKVLEGALFASSKPLLMVPAGARATLQPKRVVVAWDSGLEAVAAVRDSLPILITADEVRLVLIDPVAGEDAQGAEPGADAAAYLARHGVKVTVDRIPAMGRSIAAALRSHAGDFAAELLVMGAYGHSRLRERIFGGVTRSMLDEPGTPIFMSR